MRSFNTLTIALMPIAIVINIVIGHLVQNVLRVPFLYLDSIGTILVGVLAGPLAGAVTGFLATVIWGFLTGGTITWFTAVAVLIGVLAGIFGARGWMRRLSLALLAGLITGLIAATMSALIQAFLLGGISGGGTDVLTAFYLRLTNNVLAASLLQGYTVDPLDKIASYIVVFFVVQQLSRRLVYRFPQGEDVLPPRKRTSLGEAYFKREQPPK